MVRIGPERVAQHVPAYDRALRHSPARARPRRARGCSSSSIDDRVTRDDQGDEGQRQRDRRAGTGGRGGRRSPSPAPKVGNQPSRTAKTEIRMIAATNDGMAASTVLTTRTALSATRPGPQRADDAGGEPDHADDQRRQARSSPRVVGSRAPIRVPTSSRNCSERPKSRCSTPVSQCQYCTRNGLVEPVLRRHGRDRLGGRAAALQQEVDRVARREVERGEDQERRDEQRGDHARAAGGRRTRSRCRPIRAPGARSGRTRGRGPPRAPHRRGRP